MKRSPIGENVLNKEEILGPRYHMSKDTGEGIIKSTGTLSSFLFLKDKWEIGTVWRKAEVLRNWQFMREIYSEEVGI